MSVLDAHTFAETFLDACVDALDTIPVEQPALKGAPDRYFVSPGTPVWDCCEQLAVHIPRFSEADTFPGALDAGRRTSRGRIDHVSYLATITRCLPETPFNGDPPAVADLEAVAQQIDADGWALWNHLHNLKASAALLTLCDEMFFDGITAAVPSGGCAGWTVSVRARIGGYQEAIGS